MENISYSPNILIYLEIGKQTVRLADVLGKTATLYEHTQVPAHTMASLVLSVDGVEERERVILHEGISIDSKMISFSYCDRTV